MSGRWSGLPDDEIGELARLMLAVICEEWPAAGGKLESFVVYDRLVREGIEVRDWEMADAFELLEGLYVRPLPKDGLPDVEREAADFRRHGGLTVGDVNKDFCSGA